MEAEHEYRVAGVFESQKRADVAVERLHRIGVPDADVEVGTPEPGRYRIERHEAASVWRGVLRGMLIGAVVGVVISLGIVRFVLPGLTLAGLIELSVPMGASWGLFLGGLTGMALKAITLAEGEPRYAIPDDSSDVLVVVHAHDRFGVAHEALERQHPRYILTDVPAVRHGGPHLAATA